VQKRPLAPSLPFSSPHLTVHTVRRAHASPLSPSVPFLLLLLIPSSLHLHFLTIKSLIPSCPTRRRTSRRWRPTTSARPDPTMWADVDASATGRPACACGQPKLASAAAVASRDSGPSRHGTSARRPHPSCWAMDKRYMIHPSATISALPASRKTGPRPHTTSIALSTASRPISSLSPSSPSRTRSHPPVRLPSSSQ